MQETELNQPASCAFLRVASGRCQGIVAGCAMVSVLIRISGRPGGKRDVKDWVGVLPLRRQSSSEWLYRYGLVRWRRDDPYLDLEAGVSSQ